MIGIYGFSAVGFQTRRGYDVLQDLDRRVEATKQAMQFAYDLGASVVINQVGQIPAEPTGPRWDLLIQVLTDLGRFGQRTGAMLAVETGAEDAETLLRLIEALPDGSVGINLDPGNLIVNGYSASEAARMLGKHVLHVHAKDGVRDLPQGVDSKHSWDAVPQTFQRFWEYWKSTNIEATLRSKDSMPINRSWKLARQCNTCAV